MIIIDSQVHAYEANTPKRPWHSVRNWPDHDARKMLCAEWPRRCGRNDLALFRREAVQVDWVRSHAVFGRRLALRSLRPYFRCPRRLLGDPDVHKCPCLGAPVYWTFVGHQTTMTL